MTVTLQLGSAQFRLEGPGARIFAGRDPAACQLADGHATLSRRHAEIFLAPDGKVFIRDLGSANGTWVDGRVVGAEPTPLAPNMQVWLGHVPLGVTWPADNSKTMMSQQVPAELLALIQARQNQFANPAGSMGMPAGGSMGMPGGMPGMQAGGSMAAMQSQGQMPASGSGSMPNMPGTPHSSTPLPSDMAYRRQGSNDNGVLLLALKQDTHWCGAAIDGYVEFTALDNETVASISVELVEIQRRKSAIGQSWEKEHVWDRVLVRQGPWRAKNGDILPLPFTLRVPAGTAMTSREVNWEIRGMVDINWAVDIDAKMPITMRNQDIERLRDGMGSMDYRVVDIESVAGGQRFEGKFAPPAQLARDWGVNNVTLEIEYLGANLKVRMKLDRKGIHHDPAIDQVFELGRLRAASQPEVNMTLKSMLDQLLPKK